MRRCALLLGLMTLVTTAAQAQTSQPTTPPATPPAATTSAVPLDPSYVIGPDDVLAVLFWRDADTSSEVMVRPDGKITLPLLNDVEAAGLTPDQLRARIQTAAEKYFEEPNVSVVVRTVNSRKVFITGTVGRPGPYPLTSKTTVLQLIAMAGGLADFAKKDKIMVMRVEDGETRSYKFNYKDVSEGKKLEQNIELKPGDTVIVP